MINSKWDQRFLDLAHEVSKWSKDPSTQVGAVVCERKQVISLGYNGFPVGIDDSRNRLDHRPTKYALVVHGELNAILNARCDIRGTTLYCTHFPCNECAKAIINAGIQRVVVPGNDSLRGRENWLDAHRISMEMFEEVGIMVDVY